jgi:hypothetical protein
VGPAPPLAKQGCGSGHGRSWRARHLEHVEVPDVEGGLLLDELAHVLQRELDHGLGHAEAVRAGQLQHEVVQPREGAVAHHARDAGVARAVLQAARQRGKPGWDTGMELILWRPPSCGGLQRLRSKV